MNATRPTILIRSVYTLHVVLLMSEDVYVCFVSYQFLSRVTLHMNRQHMVYRDKEFTINIP